MKKSKRHSGGEKWVFAFYVVMGTSLLGLAIYGKSPGRSLAASNKSEVRGERGAERELLDSANSRRSELRVGELSARLNITSKELTEFFKDARAMNKGSADVWKELISGLSVDGKRDASAEDFENSDVLARLVSGYIKLRKSSAVDNFHIRESDLLSIHKSWNLTQKSNFARVLKRAAEIAKSSQYDRVASSSLTSEDAFEKALGELGYLEKYKRGCSI